MRRHPGSILLLIWLGLTVACSGPSRFQVDIDGRRLHGVQNFSVIVAPEKLFENAVDPRSVAELIGRQSEFKELREFVPKELEGGSGYVWVERAAQEDRQLRQLQLDPSDKDLVIELKLDRSYIDDHPDYCVGIVYVEAGVFACKVIKGSQMQAEKDKVSFTLKPPAELYGEGGGA